MLLLNRGGFRWGRSPTLKSKKVTLCTMILYNSENNISKPIPNKTFVMFELSYFSRYKVILSSIVFSQQCSEVYAISSYSSEAVMKLTTTEISHLNVTSWTRPCLLRAKVRSTPPDHLHSEISFSRTCNHRCRSKQNFGDAKDFCPNFPKLAQKVVVRLLPTNFLPQRSWTEDLFWCDLWKRLPLVFCKRWAPLSWSETTLGAIFAQIFIYFARTFDKSKLLRAILHPRLLHHCLQPSIPLEKHENKEKLFELNMYFVRNLARFVLILIIIHKVCNSLRTVLTQSKNIHSH